MKTDTWNKMKAEAREAVRIAWNKVKCIHDWEEVGSYRMLFEPPNVRAWQCKTCGKLKSKSF